VVEAFLAHWQEHGEAAIKVVRLEDPKAYVTLAVNLLSRDDTLEIAVGH
jgi:hypothetical protein